MTSKSELAKEAKCSACDGRREFSLNISKSKRDRHGEEVSLFSYTLGFCRKHLLDFDTIVELFAAADRQRAEEGARRGWIRPRTRCSEPHAVEKGGKGRPIVEKNRKPEARLLSKLLEKWENPL